MKKTIILLILGLTTALSSAQRSPSRGRGNVPPLSGKAATQPGHVSTTSGLEENMTLRLAGNFHGFFPLDLELTGTGPVFKIDLIHQPENEGDQPIIVTIRATVTLTPADTFRVEYDLAARIAITTSTMTQPGGKVMRNVEYRDVSLSGAANLSEGKPLDITKLNGQALTLTLSEVKETNE